MQTSTSTSNNMNQAFALLLLQLALQLLADPTEVCTSLDDVYVCYEKAQTKSKQTSKKNVEADSEPTWVEVGSFLQGFVLMY